MRPMNFDTASNAKFLQDQLFFLDIPLAAARYMRKLVNFAGNINIRSQGGLALPAELWYMILEEMEEEAERNPPRFCFAKATIVPSLSSPTETILRCVRHEFDLQVPGRSDLEYALAGNLRNPASIAHFEYFLQNATPEVAAKINEASDKVLAKLEDEYEPIHESIAKIPKLNKLSSLGNVFYILQAQDAPQEKKSGLYYDIDVPDVIARIDRGSCWVCSGRFIGCIGGRCAGLAMEMFGFDREQLGCGFSLVCPLCVGIDLSDDHLDSLHRQERIGESDEEIEQRIKARLSELGYN
ncbi:hypothetical protein B0T26DRAFT_735691 [Lasiosphaeria miniovina]|uniref:Uncharacterized protein n=1 Tax=Lasiosphaeria miniovina TaxID=1954250 RepID=A0AA39ZQZ3_9PEZI|nr:uncharacterized protein B0T26DRAFT_735691 [Lasiosphaeria miniovina]KAK0702061.1 hypothetical protein B0T26DRAFT_735691 [Lasiosphaeria miniovina]